MPILGAVIGAGASLLGGALGANAAKKAAKAQSKAQQAAIAEQRRQFDVTREDFSPYRGVGTAALNQLAALYGLPQYAAPAPGQQSALSYEDWSAQNPMNTDFSSSRYPDLLQNQEAARHRKEYEKYVSGFTPTALQPTTPAAAPDFSAFRNSPDYQFNLSEGLSAVEGSSAARGGLYSGNNLRALQERGAGIASNQFNNYTSRLAQLAGIGQGATTSAAAASSNTSTNVSNLLTAQGDARASGIAGAANAWHGALGTAGGLIYDLYRGRNPATPKINGYDMRGYA